MVKNIHLPSLLSLKMLTSYGGKILKMLTSLPPPDGGGGHIYCRYLGPMTTYPSQK
jgi:hypothetical protein